MGIMINNDQIAQLLHDRGIRPTAVRILVWKTLLAFDYAFALADLEGMLPTVDRSTLFRALTLFAEKQLLHPLDDGSGQQKYCVCCEEDDDPCDADDHDKSGHHHHLHCEHVHITCTKCGHTYCLKNEQIPQVEVPEGFQIQHIQYVIQGICPRCAHWHPKA